MKHLALSLLIAVIASLVGFGWLFNTLYKHLNSANSRYSDIAYLERFCTDLAGTVNQLQDPQSFVNSWQGSGELSLSYHLLDVFPIPASLRESVIKGSPLVLESESEYSINVYMPSHKAMLSLVLPPSFLPQENTKVNLSLTFGFYIGVMAIVLLWLYPLIRRLSVVRKVTHQFGKGVLNSRIPDSKITYIADIESEFNHMAGRIQSLINDNKLLSRAVSHDLKTPLARLRFGIDTLQELLENDTQAKYISRIQDDLDEMESLVETLLQYARLEQAYVDLNIEVLDLFGFLEVFCGNAFQGSYPIELQPIDRKIMIRGDKRYLAMVFKNLLNNASTYCNSLVKVSIIQKNNEVRVQIEDDGPGFSEDAIENAFKPFWKGEPVDNPSLSLQAEPTKYSGKTRSHGMGLAIVDRIVSWHKGTVFIDNSESLGGACIVVTLPVLQR